MCAATLRGSVSGYAPWDDAGAAAAAAAAVAAGLAAAAGGLAAGLGPGPGPAAAYRYVDGEVPGPAAAWKYEDDEVPSGRGLHSSTFRLNVSASCGLGVATKGYQGVVQGVLWAIMGCLGCILCQKRIRWS